MFLNTSKSSSGQSSLNFTNTFVLTPTSNSEKVLSEVPKGLGVDLYRQRRSHKKSRKGCENCRKRRVKVCIPQPCRKHHPFLGTKPEYRQCNEKSPCQNCLLRHEKCPSQTRPLITPTPSRLPISSSIPDIPGEVINLSHLHLFHHFQTHTKQTLLLPSSFWESNLAFHHDFLMSAIFSVSARHLFTLQPSEKKHNIAASNHLSQALSQFQLELSLPNTSIPINIDAFIATSVLLQYEVWSSTEFPSPSDRQELEFDPAHDKIFTLSSSLKQVFLKSFHEYPSLVESSILLQHVAKNPRDFLLEVSGISEKTITKYQDFFAYETSLTKEKINSTLPLFQKANQSILPASEQEHESSEPRSYTTIINTLTLILSFLPETQPETEEFTNDGKSRLSPELIRYIWSFPFTCRGPFVTLIQKSDPHALFVLYHFYRAVRILLPRDECWWAYERAKVWEVVLGRWLAMKLHD